MNFSSKSVKSKSKSQNEDFCFDVETPRGHFFAVLDFDPHDYANLNATLQAKLETMVNSFVTLSRFSAELFLGFLAKETSNFLHNLGAQSGGPELLCSAAFCLLNGNRLFYFISGDISINVFSSARLLPLNGATPDAAKNRQIERLGARHQETPLTDQVQSSTLQDDHTVLIMTHGLAKAFDVQRLLVELMSLRSSDSNLISDALMKAGAFIGDDRTLVVISGPYERYVDPVLADLSKAVASLEVRLDALTESHQSKSSSGLDNEQRSNQERSLQRKGLRLGALAAGGTSLGDKENDQTRAPAVGASTTELVLDRLLNWSGNSIVQMALLVLVVAIAGAFVGAWLQSRMTGKNQEVWSVKTAGKQIVISRRDGSDAEGSVNLNVSRPLRSTGEQTFSSFADVKQYIDTITNGEDQGNGIPLGEGITEIAIGPGDTLKKLSQRYNSTPEQIMELNPNITKWTELQIGQKIVVPSSSSPNPAASP